jgi:Protein of unknown function (DUF998)
LWKLNPWMTMRRIWLVCGVLAGPLFTLVYLAEGATRENYSAWRHPVSSLALGNGGWLQVVNFLLSGGLLIAHGIGLRRVDIGSKWLARLVIAIGAGLVGAGLFPCDPLSGYPPGTPQRPSAPSSRGALHRLFSTPVFVGLPVACIVSGRSGGSGRVWQAYSIGTCVGFVSAFAASSAGFAQLPRFVAFGGLFQRIALSIGFGWLSIHAAHLLHRGAES